MMHLHSMRDDNHTSVQAEHSRVLLKTDMDNTSAEEQLTAYLTKH
jgi:hypothetical protein